MDTEFTVIMDYEYAIGEWIAARRAAGLQMTQAREYRVKIPG